MGNLFFFDWPVAVDLFVVRLVVGIGAAALGISAVDFVRARFLSGPEGRGPRPVRPPGGLEDGYGESP